MGKGLVERVREFSRGEGRGGWVKSGEGEVWGWWWMEVSLGKMGKEMWDEIEGMERDSEKWWEFGGKTRTENWEAEEETRDGGGRLVRGNLRSRAKLQSVGKLNGIRLSQWLHLQRRGVSTLHYNCFPPLPQRDSNNQYSMSAHTLNTYIDSFNLNKIPWC